MSDKKVITGDFTKKHDVKYCCNCEYYKLLKESESDYPYEQMLCTHEHNVEICLVTGEATPKDCYDERWDQRPGNCGEGAKYFKPKKVDAPE